MNGRPHPCPMAAYARAAFVRESGYAVSQKLFNANRVPTSAMMMSQSSRYSLLVLVRRVHIRSTQRGSAIAKRIETGMMYRLEMFELGSGVTGVPMVLLHLCV
jgi:hypothetical protein